MTQPMEMLVLDCVQNDVESLALICEMLETNEEEVVAGAITHLLRDRLVEALDVSPETGELIPIEEPSTDIANLRGYWFGPTPRGRQVWARWDSVTADDEPLGFEQ
jgi:hypothetical protein